MNSLIRRGTGRFALLFILRGVFKKESLLNCCNIAISAN